MSNPLTIEQTRALKPGALLRCISNCGSGPTEGATVIFERHNSSYQDYLIIRHGAAFELGSPGGGWQRILFSPWTHERPVAVLGLDRDKSTFLQQAAFGAGFFWSTTCATPFALDAKGLVFATNKRILYTNSEVRDLGYLYLDARVELEWVAALQFFGASIGPRSIEHILTADVLSMVRSNPENPMVRGLIRAACNKAVPKETIAAGSDAIIKWLLEEFNPKPPEPAPQSADAPQVLPPPPHGADVDAFIASQSQMSAMVGAINQELAQMATAPPPPAIAIDPGVPAPPPPPPRTRRVRYNFTDIELGTCNCARTHHREGEIEVPEDIVSGGSDVVEEWIIENRTDLGRVGSIEYSGHEWDDWSEGEIHSDAGQVCDAYYEEQMNAGCPPEPDRDPFYDDNGEAYHH